jgi:hypothetical protein
MLIDSVKFSESVCIWYLNIEISRKGEEGYFFGARVDTHNHDGISQVSSRMMLSGFAKKEDIDTTRVLAFERCVIFAYESTSNG